MGLLSPTVRLMKTSLTALALLAASSQAFVVGSTSRAAASTQSSTARYNFFKNLIGGAFENDASLSKADKLEGMLDEGTEDIDAERLARVQQLTSTQQQWREKMLTPGAVKAADLQGSAVQLDLYLTGIPNKDPSNDLYGSQTKISSRDRVVGLSLPKEPSVVGVQLQFDAGGVCRVMQDESGFCSTEDAGDWKLSDDGTQIRFRVRVTGYTRTIETKGSIQKVFWTDEDEKTSQTSTVYSIPEGWMYGEAELNKPVGKAVQWNDDGVLKVERSMGLLGAASRMIPCGKFFARALVNDAVEESAKQREESTA